ncbi:hypothetical protein WN51_02758 [Melipona quadrifasciata]|uniref:Uncharacterized protein n=1 Tax=Melipona quadrifasciata TaxID=166423 RepID=A0A0M9AAU8_9HYME|nr:hypothetical protein WN51_02758 [Melipona quadrifasciata]
MHHSTKSHQGALGPRRSHLDRARRTKAEPLLPSVSPKPVFSFFFCSQPPLQPTSDRIAAPTVPAETPKQTVWRSIDPVWGISGGSVIEETTEIRPDGSQHSEHDTLFHWISFSRYVWRFEMILRVCQWWKYRGGIGLRFWGREVEMDGVWKSGE